ncbi:MAG: alpha-2-macroglobulin family protein [Hellea sp.]|nr:alpha-2-macroglobulin family protein [Hellea sp.]
MKKSWLLAIAIPILFIGAWWIGYQTKGPSHSSTVSDSLTQTDVTVKPTPQRTAESSSNEGPQTGTIRETETEPENGSRSQAGRERPLRYVGFEVDERNAIAEACFAFASPIDVENGTQIRDYIEVEPAFKFAEHVRGNDLCISGFDFSEDYEVIIKEGLLGSDNRRLRSNIIETISFGDKPKYVGFAGQGIILPRIGAQGLAVETVNIDQLEVEISRVTDRMIARRDPQVGEAILEGDYGWEGYRAATEIRSTIWEGKVDVEPVKNETVTTVLPISELVAGLDPGAYIIRANRTHTDDESEFARAWRWVIVTDIAITSYRGDDGLNVAIRSIDTARTQSDIDILLVAENNEILAKAKTDRFGHARFAAPLLNGEGSQSPKMVMAYGADQDFAILDLSRAPIDMAGHDISGRQASGNVDVYGFTERGVYRPGETVHFTAMLRDSKARSIIDRDVTLTVLRPNGIEIANERVLASEIKGNRGVINWAYEVPNSAPRGNWTIWVKADGAERNEKVEFAVEDFVPQKLKLSIKADNTPVKVGEIRELTVDAQFLYGAPGTGLSAEAEARIRIDYQPFKAFTDFQFGPDERNFREEILDLGSGVTDGAGQVTFALDYKNEAVDSVFPLRAEIVAGVAEPGGRYIKEASQIPIRTEDIYVGLASGYESQTIPRGQPAKFKIIAVNGDGERVSEKLNWKFVKVDRDYHWYRERGRWRYRYDDRDIPVSAGTIDVGADEPANWDYNISWGWHRLEIWDGDQVVASKLFRSGWYQPGEASEAPDILEIEKLTETVNAGDTVKLNVNSPYEGFGELVIASNRVHSVQPLRLLEGNSELSFKFDESWGDSVYAMLTVYTPRDQSDRPVPRRAVGISYVALDRSAQTFDLEIETPEVIRPRGEHEFIVNVNGPNDGKILMNFAAVDEGILQITKYKSPDATDHYFGKKALGIELRDDYGRILNPNLGNPTKMRSGGDSLGGEGLTVIPVKSVSLFEGMVPVKNGKAKIKMNIPEFNGELRLMATAWSDEAIGSASTPVKVRDKVPAIIATPRFLAPDDKAYVTVSLDNVEGGAGKYTASLRTTGALEGQDSMIFDLEEGQRQQDRIPVTALSTGIETVSVEIAGPSNYQASSTYPIQIRSPYYPLTEMQIIALEPGNSVSLSSDWVEKFVAEGTDVSVSFSSLPGIDPAPIVASLRKYPYGCTEQTVSTALPLLYATNLGGIPGQTDLQRRRAINGAVHKISNRMSVDGAFGLWNAGDRYAYGWVGVYATDFLYRAKAEGYYVPDDVLNRSVSALNQISRAPRYSSLRYAYSRDRSDWAETRKAEDAAYALYVLALNGHGNLGQSRYHYDNHRSKMKTPLSKAYLAGALKLLGDDRRADIAFDDAMKEAEYRDRRNYYYSETRDMAGIVAVASESGAEEVAEIILLRLSGKLKSNPRLNTQEKGYLILAFNAIADKVKPAKIKAENVTLDSKKGQPVAHLYGTDLARNPAFTNESDNRVYASVTIEGPPISAPDPISKGMTISKAISTLEGKPLGDRPVKQGERLAVKLTYGSKEFWDRNIVVADLLPAGFEIETILQPEDGNRTDGTEKGPYAWIGKISELQIAEARDDRFVASLSTNDKEQYISAYIIRAVTPGDFVLPGPVVEDMYRPDNMAIGKSSRIRVSADPSL